MKKVLALLVIVAAAIVLGYWGMNKMSTSGMAMELAFGPPTSGIPMQAVIKASWSNEDPKAPSGVWQKWIHEHFELKDSTGTPVLFSYQVSSELMPSVSGGGDAGFLSTTLTPGQVYTLVFRPDPHKSLRYQMTITAPTKATEQGFYTLDRKE